MGKLLGFAVVPKVGDSTSLMMGRAIEDLVGMDAILQKLLLRSLGGSMEALPALQHSEAQKKLVLRLYSSSEMHQRSQLMVAQVRQVSYWIKMTVYLVK